MGRVYSFEGMVPVVDPTAFVHPDAVLIGDVMVGRNCYVGACAVLRGDFGRLVMRTGSNVQDNCVLHSFPNLDVVIEEDGHVGHGAMLHGCKIGRNSLVGMNAVVMDGVTIGEEAIVGANSFVKAGTVVPPRMMAIGSPAKITRKVTPVEIGWKSEGTRLYQELAKRSSEGMVRCQPILEPEPDRPRIRDVGTVPQHMRRQRQPRPM